MALGAHAQELGADALIVADTGCMRVARGDSRWTRRLSTQAGVHSEGAVHLAADELGVERVTTARELAVDEIAALCATGVPIEVFCHGAICIGYSGACAFSALRRGRWAMRGDSTRPVSLQHTTWWTRRGGEPGVVSVEGDRLLYHAIIWALRTCRACRGRVASLKIEGRMKNPDYVFNVVQ